MSNWQIEEIILPLNRSLRSSVSLMISEFFMDQCQKKLLLVSNLKADKIQISQTNRESDQKLHVTFPAAYVNISGKDENSMLQLYARDRQRVTHFLASKINDYINNLSFDM